MKSYGDLTWDGGGVPGSINPTADAVKRKDETWSDTELDRDYQKWPDVTFARLQCRNCMGVSFEVLRTADYETTARCARCGTYYIVHNG